MKIRKIWVKNLFGIFNHNIDLFDDNLTIINGPNGYGKTAILKMISGFFNSSHEPFYSYPFTEFGMLFLDGVKLVITKEITTNGNNKIDFSPLTIQFYNPITNEHHEHSLGGGTLEELLKIPPSMIERVIPELIRSGSRTWRNRCNLQIYTFEEVIKLYGSRLVSISMKEIDNEIKEPSWLSELRTKLNVKLIETQRLLSKNMDDDDDYLPQQRNQNYFKPAVLIIQAKLAKKLQNELFEFARVSQALDRSFPTRLLSEGGYDIYEHDKLKELLFKLEQKREAYTKIGLLEKTADLDLRIHNEINDTDRKVLSLYVNDNFEKLETLEEIAHKTELFINTMNALFKPLKEIKVDKNEGIIVTNNLELSMLSSGEQHELILWYELLFNTKPGTLLLIDEPEISLHVSWQQDFTDSLCKIINLLNFSTVIATHAPGIISGYWENVVDLELGGESIG